MFAVRSPSHSEAFCGQRIRDHRPTLYETFGDLLEDIARQSRSFSRHGHLGAGVRTTDGANGTLTLSVDLPGFLPTEVCLSVDGRRLALSAEKGAGDSGLTHHSYRQTFLLPDWADASAIKASLEHGVLDVTIPKKVEAQPRKIELTPK